MGHGGGPFGDLEPRPRSFNTQNGAREFKYLLFRLP